jgi:hypothetical protein
MNQMRHPLFRLAQLVLLCLLALFTLPARKSNARSFLPDSTTAGGIAFISDRDGNRDIYTMNPDGSAQANLTHSAADEKAFTWSPDGTKIAFIKRNTANNADDSNLYVMNSDGTGVTKLTNDDFQYQHSSNLSWSPDGSKLAYVSGNDLVHYLSVVNSDGSNKHNLREINGPFFDVVWSPDGGKIAFSVGSDFNSANLWVMNADGSAVTRFTNHEEPGIYSRSPSWSPDSMRLVAPGQSSASFIVPITYDSFIEGDETVNLVLTFVGGTPKVTYGNQRHAQLTISDFYIGQPPANVIDQTNNFVRQQYHDFLGREPDLPGLSFWTNQITACGANAECIERKRADVSGAFFNSIEFQQTGYLVYRLNVASFGAFPQFRPFMNDKGLVADGVIVGQSGWQQRLEENKSRFLQEWVRRSAFIALCGGTRPNSEFVDILLTNTHIPATTEYRATLIADLDAGRKTQADVLLEIVENADFQRSEFNRAFVLMQYFGYLRRNPNDPPDTNFDGYEFWLRKLNQFNGDFRRAEMVKAFITSREYRHRFGQ